MALYIWVIKSFVHSICSNSWFIQGSSKWLFIYESLNHLFIQFVQTADSFRNEVNGSLYMSHWIIHSFDLFKQLIIQEWSKWLFINESLNHLFIRFVQTADSFMNEVNGFSRMIHSETDSTVLLWLYREYFCSQKQTILCLKQNTILTSYCKNIMYKISFTFAFVLFRLKTALVWHCSHNYNYIMI